MGMIDSARDWANRNSAAATTIAVALLVVSLVTLMMGGSSTPEPSDRAYYYDLETEEVFIEGADKTPPIKSPKGNEAVRVYFYTCGACTESERFVGYYQKFTDEAKQAIKEANRLKSGESSEEATQVRQAAFAASMAGARYSRDAEEWVPGANSGGAPFQEELTEECSGADESLQLCTP